MKKKIIIVDDSALTHDIYKVFLAKYDGLEVISCSNGSEALEAIKGGQGVGLVLLDLEMPVMDGFQFLAKKNSDGRLRGIPVVVISWKDSPENIMRAKELGVLGFVNKSEIEEIDKYIEAVVDREG